MMMPPRLTVIGDLERPDHRYLPPDAQYFWGEYTPYEHTQGKRWDYSPTNRLIANFKKKPRPPRPTGLAIQAASHPTSRTGFCGLLAVG